MNNQAEFLALVRSRTLPETRDRQELLKTMQVRARDATSPEVRYQLGQYPTDPEVAADLSLMLRAILDERQPRAVLEPAFGVGALYSVLRETGLAPKATTAFEVDLEHAASAQITWGDDVEVRYQDFLLADPEPGKYDAVVANPPYTRFQDVPTDRKSAYQKAAEKATGIRPSGRSSAATYFLLAAHAYMAPGAVGCWVLPSTWQVTRYGRAIREYLSTQVTLKRVHRYPLDSSVFKDALVSTVLVSFVNTPPADDHEALFTEGGRVNTHGGVQVPVATLATADRWNQAGPPVSVKRPARAGKTTLTLGDVASVMRGILTGRNEFFTMPAEKAADLGLPASVLDLYVPPPRMITGPKVEAAEYWRHLQATREPEHPAVRAYLDQGVVDGVNQGRVCARRTESGHPWYSQESREPCPILVTYMGRSKAGKPPLRFVFNPEHGTAGNAWLMIYPRAGYSTETLWRFLQRVSYSALVDVARVYNGGLYKVEPRGLENLQLR